MKSRSALPGRPSWVGRGGPLETDRSLRRHQQKEPVWRQVRSRTRRLRHLHCLAERAQAPRFAKPSLAPAALARGLAPQPMLDLEVALLAAQPLGEERLDDGVLAALTAPGDLLADEPGERGLQARVRRQLVPLVIVGGVRRGGRFIGERLHDEALVVRGVLPELREVVVL